MTQTTGQGNSNPRLGFGNFSGLHIATSQGESQGASTFSGANLLTQVLGSAPLSETLSSGRARNLSEAISQLNSAERQALQSRWGRSLEEIGSLSHEHDPQIFYHGLLQIGQRLEDNEQLEQAGIVYSALVAGNSPHPPLTLRGGEDGVGGGEVPPLRIRGGQEGLALVPAGIRDRAQVRLNAMTGVGAAGERIAFLARRISTEATRPDMLFAMGAAGATFRLARLATTARLAGTVESGLALNAATYGSAFLAETVAFTGVGKVAGQAFGYQQDWSPEAVFHEWAGGATMLLGLKVTGALAGAAAQRYARGPGALERFTQAALPQVGMFGGILLGHRLEEAAGFRARREGDTWFVDGLSTLLQFNVAGRLQGAALGEGFTRFERRLDMHTEMLSREATGRPGILDSLAAMVAPDFVTPEGIRVSQSEGPSATSPADRHPYPSPPRGEGHTISLVSPSPLGGEGGRRPGEGLVFSVRHDGEDGSGGHDSEPPSSGVRPSVPPQSDRIPVAPQASVEAADPIPPTLDAAQLQASSAESAPARISDTSVPRPWLLVTGGSSGIGADLVLQAAQRGYQILFGGTRAFGDLGRELQILGVQNYLRMDVRDPAAINTFRDIALGRQELNPAPMLVVASAGISARGSEAEIENMRQINVGGTRYLLEAFAEGLKLTPGSRFVGVSSIVAAEGLPVRGDNAYAETKAQIHDMMLMVPDSEHTRGVEAFSLVPGAVDTPMTRGESIFGMLMAGLVQEGVRSESPLRARLAAYLGGESNIPAVPAELLRTLLGETLTQAANFSRIERLMRRDPQLSGSTSLVLGNELAQPKEFERLRKNPEDPQLQASIPSLRALQDQVVRTLVGLDLAILPEVIAPRLLDQFESGKIPERRMLRVYSADRQDLILSLLGSTGEKSPATAVATEGSSSGSLSPRALSVPPPAPETSAPVPEVVPAPRMPEAETSDSETVRRMEGLRTQLLSERPTAQTGLSSIGIRRQGEGWAQDVSVTPKEARYYGVATGNVMPLERGVLPSGMSFSRNLRATVEAIGEAMKRAPRPTVVHGSEKIQYFSPWRPDLPVTITNSSKTKGREGTPQAVELRREIRNHEGELLVSGRSMLFVGPDYATIRPTVLSDETLQKLPPQAVLTVPVTRDLVDTFAEASGDYNPVHVDDNGARELGLPGRILHGMATFNFAERALFQFLGEGGPSGPYELESKFKWIAQTESEDGSRPGDVLRFFAEGGRQQAKVTVLNQRNELVMTLDYHRLPPPEIRVPSKDVGQIQPSQGKFGRFEIEVDAPRGYQLVQKAVRQMSPHLPRLREVLGQRAEQPWFIAGMSDGMGFHYAVALLAAGVRNLVGGYYEPDALLNMGSEVHLARVARAEGLRIFSGEIGANLEVFYENLVLAGWRNYELRKDESGKDRKIPISQPVVDYRALPEPVRLGIEAAQRRSWVRDLHAANSIAFAQHISPAPGVPRLMGIPTLDLEGNVVLSDMKPYDEVKYQQGTMDPMGRNQEALLQALTPHFGPQSTSYFFTWAGGSQNFHILNGIYGRGSLGDAKEAGETATVRYHLSSQDQGFNRGVHKIVRFPDFPTFALFGIPGGGGMGMIARHVLEGHGRYMDVPDLAPLSLIAALGGENNLRNPAAQVELDVPETYHIREIADDLGEFHRRVAEHRATHPDRWMVKKMGMFSIPSMTPEDSRAILLGSALDYRLAHPELEGSPIPPEVWQELRRGPNRPLVNEDYRDHIPSAWD